MIGVTFHVCGASSASPKKAKRVNMTNIAIGLERPIATACPKSFGETEGQALYSYKLRFDFPTDAGILNYLRGREFEVTDIDFVNKYFG